MSRRMDRILVVDDDVELCGLVEEYLAAEGYTVQAAHDGEAGNSRGFGERLRWWCLT